LDYGFINAHSERTCGIVAESQPDAKKMATSNDRK